MLPNKEDSKKLAIEGAKWIVPRLDYLINECQDESFPTKKYNEVLWFFKQILDINNLKDKKGLKKRRKHLENII